MKGKSTIQSRLWPALVVGMAALTGARASGQDLHIGPAYTDSFPVIEVVVEPPEGIEKPKTSEYFLLEDGQLGDAATGMKLYRQTERGVALVAVLDVSGSMKGDPIDSMKRALTAMIASMGPQDRVALITVADDVLVEANFGDPAETVKTAIERLKSRGTITELHKGLFKALNLLEEKEGLPERKRLVVISDGKDEGTAYTLDDVVQQAHRQGVAADGVGMTRIDPKYLSALERLADLTGGRYARANSPEDLEAVVKGGIEFVENTPVFSFKSKVWKADGTKHQLGVRFVRGSTVNNGSMEILLLGEGPGGVEVQKWPAWYWYAGGGGGVLLLGLLIFGITRLLRKKPVPPPPIFPPPKPDIAPPVKEDGVPAWGGGTSHEGISGRGPTEPEVKAVWGAEVQPEQPGPPAENTAQQPPKKRKGTVSFTFFQPPRPGAPTAIFECTGGPAVGRKFPMEQKLVWVGSEPGNDFAVEEDTFLSTNHAYIRFEEGNILLYDNQSTNGTYVNENKVEGVGKALQAGDAIRMGGTVLVVKVGG